ncbi:hypothetical protein HW115_13235 [Verrucomicrobiaceae bacterium N1E253]|uniref:Uncharacterized protein n=1 Tax=Oceaniferula marina TaxID=2748318 RepID=A0A851GHA3_9BACT|nr:hypothetical protein [Oceaniferula marina]NWK56579.1 hypothetical protein [Oceaniferula marina]
MPRTSDHKQHINVRATQMEMSPRGAGAAPLSEDFTGKLQEAQSQLELLQQQQAEVERQKLELQELNEHKDEFLQGQIEINEKLNTAITAMDREIFATRQELEELEQARICFADHLEKIDQLNPDGWNNESLRQDLSRALSVLDLAEDEYEQAVAHFSSGRSSSVFGGGGAKPKRVAGPRQESELLTQFRNGFAYNFPLVLLGIVAMIVYLLK